jgi:hypothetical protein
MRTWKNVESALEAEAIVRRVDPINRELAAQVDGVLVTIYVPPACAVMLRGERIKLRMVQPRDRVRVTCSQYADSITASTIQVQPGLPTSSGVR